MDLRMIVQSDMSRGERETGGNISQVGSLLFVNPLRERHGSTYRARNLARLMGKKKRVFFYEPDNDQGKNPAAGDKESWFDLVRLMSGCLRTCLRTKFDLLFLQKPMILTWPCLTWAKLSGKRVVIDFDDLDSSWQTSKFKRRLADLGERVMPKWADVITTHNEYLQAHIRRRCNKPIFLVPQGVDTGLFDPKRFSKQEEKRKMGLQNRKVFCFLGSFTGGSAADLDLILRAFKVVGDVEEDARLLIIGGGGPLEEHYLSMISDLGLDDRVIITGRKDQALIPRYLCCADYGLVFMRDNPANQYRVSLKLLEYLSMELPVIGHVVGHSRDALGSYILSCKPEVPALTETMLDGLRDKLKNENARPFVVEKCDWNTFLPAVDKVLNYCEARELWQE